MVAGDHPGRGGAEARVSVIVPCHEDGAFLPETLASIREDEPVEIVVVDDGSRDATTVSVLAELEEAGFKVLRHEENRGVSAARMTGLEATHGAFVCPLDADDLLMPGVLGQMAAKLEATDAAVCFGDYIELFPHRLILRAVPDELDPYRLAFTNEYPPTALFRRAALQRIGGWRPIGASLDARSDWSLWMGLAAASEPGTHLDHSHPTYMRRMHGGRLSTRARRRERELGRAIRAAHPEIFGSLKEHRRRTPLSRMRRNLYPVVYGARVPGIDWRVKSGLDRLGVWTLQRDLGETERARVLQTVRDARAQGARLTGRGPAPIGVGVPRPPVIVIGSGRSGTAYVSRVLEGLGVFMGASQDENAEAYHFIRLNTAILARAGVSWSDPEPLREAIADPRFRARARSFLTSRVRVPFGGAYLGFRQSIRSPSIRRLRRPWGWKDPRNTFTLPLWLDVFPDARVIHVVRHGADVSGSFWVKQQRPRRLAFLASAAAKRRYHVPTIAREARVWMRTRGGFPRVTRFDSPEEGIALWDIYETEAERHAASLGDACLELRFEEMMAEPARHIRALAAFCEVAVSDERVSELAAAANPSRAFAFLRDPELRELAARSAELLARHGYAPDGSPADD